MLALYYCPLNHDAAWPVPHHGTLVTGDRW